MSGITTRGPRSSYSDTRSCEGITNRMQTYRPDLRKRGGGDRTAFGIGREWRRFSSRDGMRGVTRVNDLGSTRAVMLRARSGRLQHNAHRPCARWDRADDRGEWPSRLETGSGPRKTQLLRCRPSARRGGGGGGGGFLRARGRHVRIRRGGSLREHQVTPTLTVTKRHGRGWRCGRGYGVERAMREMMTVLARSSGEARVSDHIMARRSEFYRVGLWL
jgi:hypothetical protein